MTRHCNVMIGPNVSIITTGHPIGPSQRRAFVVAKPIVIERNVWIAASATIISGVTVGENSVVAAGSIVTRDVPPNGLVGGDLRGLSVPLSTEDPSARVRTPRPRLATVGQVRGCL